MTIKKDRITLDFSEKFPKNTPSPSQLVFRKPAPVAGFSIISTFRDKMGTKIKHTHFRPAKIHQGKRWYVWYSYLNPVTGKMQRFKIYENLNQIPDLKERMKHAEDLRTMANYGLMKGWSPYDTEEITLTKTWSLLQGINYFKQNLVQRGLRKRTIQSYESVIRLMYLGLKPVLLKDINDITKQNIEGFLRAAYTENKWANSTFNNNLTFIRSIFNYLIEAEIMEKNPARSIKPLPENIKRHKYFDDETFEKIKKNSAPELLKFLMFLYHTGTRPNEARQLRYDHIIRDRKLLLIPSSISKNKKDGYVPLSDFILNNFKGEGFIFGTAINHFTNKFNKLKTDLKLGPEYTLYSIKHTRAVHLAQDGASPYSIMQLFRHSGLDITMTYLRDLGFSVNREAADKARF